MITPGSALIEDKKESFLLLEFPFHINIHARMLQMVFLPIEAL